MISINFNFSKIY